MSNTGDRQWVEVAASADVQPDMPFEAVIGDAVIIVIRHADGINAYQGLCPHQFARLVEGRVEDGFIHCPRHMAKFHLADGSCGPGWVLPPLKRFAVREADGRVLVDRNPLSLD